MPVAIVVLSLQHQCWSDWIGHELSVRHDVLYPLPFLHLLSVYLLVCYLLETCIDPVLAAFLAALHDLVVVGLLDLAENCVALLIFFLEFFDLVGKLEIDLIDSFDLLCKFFQHIGVFLNSGPAKTKLILVLD